MPLTARDRPAPDDVRRVREAWAPWQAELTEADLERFVFHDEAAVRTAMTPLQGRAPRGEWVVDSVPHGTWERLTIAAGSRLAGVCAALAHEGGTPGEAWEAFAAQSLGPGLRRGDIVLMDRLCSHSHPDVRAVYKGWGVEVRLRPVYSPDLNPIEQAGSKIKGAVRRARPRTAPERIAALGAALRAVTPEDIRGWFAHRGYHPDS